MSRNSKPTLWITAALSLTALLFVGFGTATEALLRLGVEPNEPFNKQIGVFRDARERGVTDAIFGDSLLARGVIIDQPDFVNLASGGDSEESTLLKVKGLYGTGAAGRVILPANAFNLQASPPADAFAFASYRESYLNRRRPLLRTLESRHQRHILNYWRVALIKGTFRADIDVPEFGGQVPSKLDQRPNFSARPLAERVELSKITLAAFRAAWPKVESVDELFSHEVTAIHHETLRYLRDRGADVCLVRTPHSPTFRRIAATDAAHTFANAVFLRLAETYGARFVDRWSYFETDEFFWDEIHMNEAAGRKFGPKIVSDCFPEDTK
jgi:hypothetical protein